MKKNSTGIASGAFSVFIIDVTINYQQRKRGKGV